MTSPFPRSNFAADAADVRHETSRSIELQLLKNGRAILSETYTPDADGQVVVRGLADILSTALYGELAEGIQENGCATFSIEIDRKQQWKAPVYSMRLRNPHDPDGQKAIMGVARETVCHGGTPFLLTVVGVNTITLLSADGKTLGSTSIGSSAGTVTTVDCDPAALFPALWQQGELMTVGDEMTVHVLPPRCDRNVVVRFLNRYDMPETLMADRMEEKPATEDSTALMGGLRTRFSVKNSTEYTLHSGPLPYADMLDTWHDLLTSRRAQLLHHGQWVDIVVTKGSWTRQRRDFYGSDLQLSFQTANPLTLL